MCCFYFSGRRRHRCCSLVNGVQACALPILWVAAKLVPVDSQLIIPYLSWLRYAGLAILLLIEIRLALILFKLVFKPDTTESQLQESGMPPLLAKAALLEARFWRWVFGVFGR